MKFQPVWEQNSVKVALLFFLQYCRNKVGRGYDEHLELLLSTVAWSFKSKITFKEGFN